MNNTYDYIIIGSGLVSIIESLALEKSGKSVLVIERKSKVGGVWVAINVGEYGRLELGCHIWTYQKRSYRFLRKFLDIQLIKVSPQPFFLKGNIKLIYDYKVVLITLERVFRDLFSLKLKSLFKYVFFDPASRFSLFPKKYLYPIGGAKEFQSTLQNKLNDSNIEVVLNTGVQRLTKTGNDWLVETKAMSYKAKNVVLTVNSTITEIVKNNRRIKLQHKSLNYVHFHIVLKGSAKEAISYIRVLDNRVIHRVSDISYQLDAKHDNHIMLLVGVFENAIGDFANDESLVQYILDFLQAKNFIDKENELLFSQKNIFENNIIQRNQLDEIRNFDSNLELLTTTDLMYGIYHRLNKWKNLI